MPQRIYLATRYRLRRRQGRSEAKDKEWERRAVPKSVAKGTILERTVIKWLQDRNIRWAFQKLVGGTTLAQPPRMDVVVYGYGPAPLFTTDIETQGLFWHLDAEKDLLRRRAIELTGIRVVYLWEPDILRSADTLDAIMRDALRGIERPAPDIARGYDPS